MKTNKMMRIASVLLVAVLLTTCVISGTFAKYTTTATANADSARVAKWDVKLEGASMTNTFTFDLFNTVGDTDDADDDKADDASVKNGTDEVIIAPGTEGSFELNLKNDSEVDATYAIDYTVTNTANIPVKFAVKVGDGEKSAYGELADVSATAFAMGADVAITIYWQWAFNGNDTDDTNLGTAAVTADQVISVAAAVTVEQVD